MIAGQRLNDNNGKQVCLFPLTGFNITQTDHDTFSHGGGLVYWATDYIAIENGNRVYHAPCYAPVDIKLIFTDSSEAMAVWESINRVHFASGRIDYLTITCYHDNNIEDNTYFPIGTIKRQGEVYFHTGDGGTAYGDHVHIETGYGRYNSSSSTPSGTAEYKYHITDYTTPKRVHNYDALFVNDTNPISSPTPYVWKTYQGGVTPSSGRKTQFPWVLYANKIRNKLIF